MGAYHGINPGMGWLFAVALGTARALGGDQYFSYDFWWHLGFDTVLTSEWGTPNMFENGLVPEKLLGGQYGHRLHVWDLVRRRHLQTLDAGAEHQLIFELRPAHDPTRCYGFVNTVLSNKDLLEQLPRSKAAHIEEAIVERSSSIWRWQRENGSWSLHKVIDIPAEPADPARLPPVFKSFGAAPPLVTDINLCRCRPRCTWRPRARRRRRELSA